MRIRLPLGRSMFFLCALLLALVALIPMRLGLGWLGLGERGMAAREARGSIWNGALGEAQIGSADIGDLRAGLAMLPLLLGRARIGLEREGTEGGEDAIHGAITVSRRGFGIDDMRARLRGGEAFGPLAPRAIDLDNVSARFENGLCASAEGLVGAELGGDFNGVPLPATLTGNARCDEGALLLPLTGQSGMEQLNLRLGPGAAWTVELVVNPGDETHAARLAAAGFTPGASGYVLSARGVF